MELTESQRHALHGLAEKRAGATTVFVNIADARFLTDLGYATRSRQGWDITSAGVACLAALENNDSTVTQLFPSAAPPAEPE